jgi:hypothetical protein
MRHVTLIAGFMVGACSFALAQGTPSGRGSVTGDPAASSANPSAEPPGTSGRAASSPSGSGASTSGGKDDNNDQGRDKMPESNKSVRPNDPDKK